MRKLTGIENENLAFLTGRKVPYGLFVPTPTGLKKHFVDATADFRAFLKANSIFDFDIDGPRTFDVRLVTSTGASVESEGYFYRPKRGDRRMRFSSLEQIASPWDAVIALWLDDKFWLVNISLGKVERSAREYPSALRDYLRAELDAPEIEDAVILADVSAGNARHSKPQRQAPEVRRAIELRAVELATEFLEAQDFVVKDVGANESYDLDAVRGSERIFVEVKGTVSLGSRVVLTRKEVELHQIEYPYNMLIVVSNIVIDWEARPPSAYGGDLRYWAPWDVQHEALEVISYTYDVPSDPKRTTSYSQQSP